MEKPFHALFLDSGSYWQSLVSFDLQMDHPDLCHPVHMTFCVCVCLCTPIFPSYKDTSHLGLRSPMTSSQLITSSVTLFPNKVTFWDIGGGWVGAGLQCKFCCCCYSVTQSSPTLCDPKDCSTPGLPVLHHLPEFAQVHVHCIGDAVQPSHHLAPSSSFLSLSQHQRLCQ